MTSDFLQSLIDKAWVGSKPRCPACDQQGMLLGDLEVDPQVDADWNRDGVIYNVAYDYFLIPESFYCHVCALWLVDTEELGMCGLPNETFKLSDDEITDELIGFARDQEAWLHESEVP